MKANYILGKWGLESDQLYPLDLREAWNSPAPQAQGALLLNITPRAQVGQPGAPGSPGRLHPRHAGHAKRAAGAASRHQWRRRALRAGAVDAILATARGHAERIAERVACGRHALSQRRPSPAPQALRREPRRVDVRDEF